MAERSRVFFISNRSGTAGAGNLRKSRTTRSNINREIYRGTIRNPAQSKPQRNADEIRRTAPEQPATGNCLNRHPAKNKRRKTDRILLPQTGSGNAPNQRERPTQPGILSKKHQTMFFGF